MVRNKKTRSGHNVDNGSSSGLQGDPERQADKGDKSLSSTGQEQFKINHQIKQGIVRLNAAVLIQAMKDLCSDKESTVHGVVIWTTKPMFREVCDIAGVEHESVADRIEEISDMPLRIRRDLVHKVIGDARGMSFGRGRHSLGRRKD